MSEDPLRIEANRAAHRGMRVLVNTLIDNPRALNVPLSRMCPELVKVAREYEEIQRRQQKEATA